MFARRRFVVLLAALATYLHAQVGGSEEPAAPGREWRSAKPESLGYSTARLEALRAWLKTEPTGSMMIVVRGSVIFEYGDVAKVSKIASIRKAILTMMYGKHVLSGKIDLNNNVKQLGLEERSAFLPIEERATLEQLITARSGIYLDPRTDDLARRQPERGSEFPGTAFFYNNWEFDAAGTAFEKLTGTDIYDALELDLAKPLGMQDFHRDSQKKIPTPNSVHSEYAMYLSTRDMARLGWLMLRKGNWNGREILPYEWCKYITSIVTPWEEMNPPLLRSRGTPERWGFGAGWWVWDATSFPGSVYESPFQGAFEARGAGGQYITVIPAREMVIVHKVDLAKDPAAAIAQEEWDAITQMAIASMCRRACN